MLDGRFVHGFKPKGDAQLCARDNRESLWHELETLRPWMRTFGENTDEDARGGRDRERSERGRKIMLRPTRRQVNGAAGERTRMLGIEV